MNGTRIVMLVVSVAAATGHMALAGPLTPPPGPVAPTHKTLTEVEPRIAINAANTPGDVDSLFKITQSGSYYLTGNIIGVSLKNGIEIAASGVTLDLMGFDLVGVAGTLNGVRVSVIATNIAVVNGSVRNWADDGLDLLNATNTRLADLRVSGNVETGINASTNAVVTGCAAYLNGEGGIRATHDSTMTNCSARENSGGGIHIGSGSITNCSTHSNTGNGIVTGSGSTITNCSTIGNTGNGISTLAGNTITNCSAAANTLDGILVSNDCTVRGNTCNGNGSGAGDGAGIHATGGDNRIEGNNCTDADRGIDVDGAGNFITHNTCSGNTTNWDVAAGNVCLVVSATTSAAILGNSGGVAPGSTDPNANFTY